MAKKSQQMWIWLSVLALIPAAIVAVVLVKRGAISPSKLVTTDDDPALSQIDPDGPWEKVEEGGAALAVPKGWTTLDKFSPQVLIFRKSNGQGGVPKTDEAGAQLEAQMILEKIRMDPGLEDSATVVADRILKEPQTTVVVRPTGESIKLADGTDAFLMHTELVRGDAQRTLMIKLLAKSDERTGFVVTTQITGSKESAIPTADSKLGQWLRALARSLVLDGSKLDVRMVNKAYRERDKK
jgi:hypothetical protein